MLKWLMLPMVVLAYLASTVSAGAPRDRDHDRLPDRWERKHHLSTAKPSAKRDPDRDRLKNRRELRLRTHPRRADTDRDRLRDGAEVRRFHTNPRKRDTDGDGFNDRCEVRKGTNPRKRRSHPKRRCSKSPQERTRLVPPPPPARLANDRDGDGFVGQADFCPNQPGDAPDGCRPPLLIGGGGDSGQFAAECFYNHTSHDDPIVFPGQPGLAHMHDFIGNLSTNAFSTNASLRSSPTNCDRLQSSQRDGNHSAYWVPALIVDGVEVKPRGADTVGAATAHYTLNRRRPGNVQPFGVYFKVIAGIATGGPAGVNAQQVYRWSCPGGVGQQPTAPGGFPLCNTNRLDLNLRFGDCWDGRMDSPNHRDHATYSAQTGPGSETRACPSSHPIEIPSLQLILRYPTRGGPTTRLSSGDMTTTHADFMNGWDMGLLRRLVTNCINANRYCGGQDTPVPGHP